MTPRFIALSLLALACTGPDSTDPDSTDALSNPEVVAAFFQAVGAADHDAIEALVQEDYIQHSAFAADGREGLLDALPILTELEVETHRVFVDGDHVALHQTYTLPDSTKMVAFDVFRVEDGQLAEHWDALQAEVPASQTASGRSMTDGPTQATDTDSTEANRALVTEFVDVVLSQGQFDRLADFISVDQYDQHNPGIEDGLDGLGALATGLQEAGLTFYYTASPLVVAEGDFVLVGSEGVFGPAEAPPLAVFYDLWRVQDGKIVEHWDVLPLEPDPSALPHDNGFF